MAPQCGGAEKPSPELLSGSIARSATLSHALSCSATSEEDINLTCETSERGLDVRVLSEQT